MYYAKWKTKAVFFILPRLTRANPGIYLAILFYQPGKNWAIFFTRLVKKNGYPGYPAVKAGRIKNMAEGRIMEYRL